MKYVIYEMIQPDHLKEIVQDAYYTKTVYRDILQELDVSMINSEHLTMESAISEISNNVNKLGGLKLTILPIIEISWDGTIKN